MTNILMGVVSLWAGQSPIFAISSLNSLDVDHQGHHDIIHDEHEYDEHDDHADHANQDDHDGDSGRGLNWVGQAPIRAISWFDF